METKINNENKAKFFGNYHGQNIGFWYRSKKDYRSGFTLIGENYGSISYLELKSLSDISDEDAIEVAKIVSQYTGRIEVEQRIKGGLVFLLPYVSEKLLFRFKNLSWHKQYYETDKFDSLYKYPVDRHLNVADFLRSRGYLVPWMGLSCEEIIEAGWAKYK